MMTETRNPVERPAVAEQPPRHRRHRLAGAMLAGMLAVGALVGGAVPAAAAGSATAGAAVETRPQAAALTVDGCARSHPTLRPGSRGGCVVALQYFLRSIAYVSGDQRFNPGPLDGIYGSRTASAVRYFQSFSNISVDGIVGVQTWKAIHADCRTFAERGAKFCYEPIKYIGV